MARAPGEPSDLRSLSNRELKAEYRYWSGQREELKHRNISPDANVLTVVKWVGNALTWVGPLVAFLSWPIGLPIALLALILHLGTDPLTWYYERRTAELKALDRLASKRQKAVFAEMQRRYQELRRQEDQT